jgi:hypothetical protein
MDDPIFIYMQSSDGGGDYFFSLYQIVSAQYISDDQHVLHTIDGKRQDINGKEAVSKLFTILVEHAMSLDDGRPLTEILAELPRKGPTLIKRPEPES